MGKKGLVSITIDRVCPTCYERYVDIKYRYNLLLLSPIDKCDLCGGRKAFNIQLKSSQMHLYTGKEINVINKKDLTLVKFFTDVEDICYTERNDRDVGIDIRGLLEQYNSNRI